VVLALATISLAVRRQGPGSLGFRRMTSPLRAAWGVLLLTLGWSVLQFGLVMPLANRVTGSRQDMTVFTDLEGNTGLLLGLLVASWTLAALGEETVFRGYLPARLQEVVGSDAAPRFRWLVVLVPAVLFSMLHLEQGEVGVLVTFLDALFFTWVRTRYDSVWAAVLAHGFSNTLGLTTFYFLGPLYGLW
jgi:membrane protease YdiL (CAAX protease family)